MKIKKCFIFDLGGITFNITIIIINNYYFEVNSNCNDNYFGGENFDNRLLNYCLKEFKE